MIAIKEGSQGPLTTEDLQDQAYSHLLGEAELTAKFLADPDAEIVGDLAKVLS